MVRILFPLLLLVLFTGCEDLDTKKHRYLIKGNDAVKSGNVKDGLKFYREALQLDSCFADAYNNIGVVYSERKEQVVAVDYFNEAIQCSPEFVPALLNRAKALYETNQLYGALEDLKFVDSLVPDSSYVHFSMGLVHTKLREYDEALKNFTDAYTLDNGNHELLVNRGSVYYYKGEYAKAREDFNRGLDINPKEGNAYNGLALIAQKEGNLTEALDYLEKALALEPDQPYFLNNRGYIRLLSRDTVKGVEDIDLSISLDAGNAWSYRNKGWYYYMTGQYREALTLLQQASQMDPFTEHVFYMMATVYFSLDNTPEGCMALAKALQAGDVDTLQFEDRYCHGN